MENFFKEFAKNIVTKEDLIFFTEEINSAKNYLFKDQNLSLSEKLRGKVSKTFENFIKNLEKEKIISMDPEKNRIFFENLKKYLLKIPQIKIEIAFEPTEEFILKISSWLEKNFGEKIILDLISNPEIVGGAIIEYKGKYLNFSLAKEIDELISKRIK